MNFRCILFLALFAAAGVAQTPAKPVVYAVSTVKPSSPNANGAGFMFNPTGLSIENVSLKSVILAAYNLQDDQIANVPDWVKTARYDITAKVDDEDREALAKISIEDRRAMVKPLLVERFGLKAHIETRELPIYALVVAKGGSKMEAVAAADVSDKPHQRGIMGKGRGDLTGMEATTEMITSVLSRSVNRTVVDRTGLTGKYNFTLKWTDDAAPANPESNAPSLFTALQEQLGLKLEATKAPLPVVVIDSIAQPTAD